MRKVIMRLKMKSKIKLILVLMKRGQLMKNPTQIHHIEVLTLSKFKIRNQF
jgi:hypothetical protein